MLLELIVKFFLSTILRYCSRNYNYIITLAVRFDKFFRLIAARLYVAEFCFVVCTAARGENKSALGSLGSGIILCNPIFMFFVKVCYKNL